MKSQTMKAQAQFLTIKDVTISSDTRGLVYSIPAGMSGRAFESFKRKHKAQIDAFKASLKAPKAPKAPKTNLVARDLQAPAKPARTLTEKAIDNVELREFPAGLVYAVKGKSGWELETVYSEALGINLYNINFYGQKVISFGNLTDSKTCHRTLRLSVINLLEGVYSDKMTVNYINSNRCDSTYREGSYAEKSI